MSVRAYAAVWADKRPIKPGPRVVLLALADIASERGWCFPSVDTIAEMALLSSRRTVDLILWLEKNEFLIVHEGCGWKGTNLYGIAVICDGKYDPPSPSEIEGLMRGRRQSFPQRKPKQGGEIISGGVKKLHPEKQTPKTSPEPSGTNTPPPEGAGAVEWPEEEAVLFYGQSYPGNMAKAIPPVIPPAWTKSYWGWRTFRLRQWIPTWQTEMVWRFEMDYQKGLANTRHVSSGQAGGAQENKTADDLAAEAQMREVERERNKTAA